MEGRLEPHLPTVCTRVTSNVALGGQIFKQKKARAGDSSSQLFFNLNCISEIPQNLECRISQ